MYAFKLVNYNLEVHTVNIYVNFEKTSQRLYRLNVTKSGHIYREAIYKQQFTSVK